MFIRLGVLLCVLLLWCSPAFGTPILFLSTQLTPPPEAATMRQVILDGFPYSVDFEPYDRSVFNARVLDLVSSPSGIVVLGGVQEDFSALHRAGALADVESLWPELSDRAFLPGVAARAKLGTDRTYFIPWMQATYLMAANRRALRYLPPGADLKRLSYHELLEWAANMYHSTGKARLGFPAGPKGLMVRFLEGFLYPSFTGSMTDGFSSPPAVEMWQYLRDLWQFVAPSSMITYRMDDALLNGEVWVAWDHTARLSEAFKKRPDEFVAFPAPVGPRGRGFISVLTGLGVPKGSSALGAGRLMEFLTRPPVQVQTLESLGFLPVVQIGSSAKLSKGLSALVQAMVEQTGSRDAILSSVPLQVADAGKSFDLAYMVAFSRIVLRKSSAQAVLEAQAKWLPEAEKKPRADVLGGRGDAR